MAADEPIREAIGFLQSALTAATAGRLSDAVGFTDTAVVWFVKAGAPDPDDGCLQSLERLRVAANMRATEAALLVEELTTELAESRAASDRFVADIAALEAQDATRFDAAETIVDTAVARAKVAEAAVPRLVVSEYACRTRVADLEARLALHQTIARGMTRLRRALRRQR